MITLTCKSFRVRQEGENIVLDIDDAQPKNLVPQLMTKEDIGSRLRTSPRNAEGIAKAAGLTPIRVGGQNSANFGGKLPGVPEISCH